MGLVSRYLPTGYRLESTRFHWPKLVICEVITGTPCTLIVGSYLLLSTLAHLPNLEEALSRFRGQDPFVLVDINMDLDEAQNPRS